MTLALFPQLERPHFVHVNLDAEARFRQKETPKLRSSVHPNPFLDPAVCDSFVRHVASKHGADFSYGGYLEDRRFLWKLSYLDDTKNFLHLGVDFNVPTGTKVAGLFHGQVIRVDNDHPTESGWGPRVILRPDNGGPYCIFAHLSELGVAVGDHISAGTILGQVGRAPFNGNWFPHLHIQTVIPEILDPLLSGKMEELDGYGDQNLGLELRRRFPDPLQFEWLVGAVFCSQPRPMGRAA